jgi:putative inorganic carbon (hco3(-)) transporter
MTTATRVGRGTDLALVVGVAALSLLFTTVAVLLSPALAIAGAVGVVGAVAIVENPRLGVLAVGAFAILRLPEVATDFHGAPSTFTPLLGFILLAVLARAIRTGEPPHGGGRAAVGATTLVGIAFVSLLFADDFGAGFTAAVGLAKDGAIAIVVGILLTRVSTLRHLVWVLISGGLFLAALSVFQFVFDLYGSSFGGFAQSALQHVAGTSDDVRISGPIGDPNFYAQWMVLLIPLAIDRFHDENSRMLRLVAAGATATYAAVVVITFSRGALVALVVVVGLMMLRYPPKRSTVAAVLALGFLSLPLLPPGYVDRMVALTDLGGVDIGTDPSLRAREVEVTVATQMFLDNPLSGIGYGNFLTTYESYARPLGIEQRNKPREAHNLYLETAAETGVPGVIVLSGFFASAFLALTAGRRLFRAMGDHRTDGIGHAVGIALVGYLITSVFLHMAYARPFFVLVGVAFAFPALARAENLQRDRSLVAS